MKFSTLLKKAGSVQAIADALGISHQAVYAWGGKVPPLRVFQLQAKRPDWFKAGSSNTAQVPMSNIEA